MARDRKKHRQRKGEGGGLCSSLFCLCISDYDSGEDEPLHGPSLAPVLVEESDKPLSAYDSEWPVQPIKPTVWSKTPIRGTSNVRNSEESGWSEPSNQYNSSASTVVYESLFQEHQRPKPFLRESSSKRSQQEYQRQKPFLSESPSKRSQQYIPDVRSRSSHELPVRKKSKLSLKSMHRYPGMAQRVKTPKKRDTPSKGSLARRNLEARQAVRRFGSGRHSPAPVRSGSMIRPVTPQYNKPGSYGEPEALNSKLRGVNFADVGDKIDSDKSDYHIASEDHKYPVVDNNVPTHGIMKTNDSFYEAEVTHPVYRQNSAQQIFPRSQLSKNDNIRPSHRELSLQKRLFSNKISSTRSGLYTGVTAKKLESGFSSGSNPEILHNKQDTIQTETRVRSELRSDVPTLRNRHMTDTSSEYLTAQLISSSSDQYASTTGIPTATTPYSNVTIVPPSRVHSDSLTELREQCQPFTGLTSYSVK